MTDVLVLVEHTSGEPKNTTVELLTAASTFGTPAAVVVGAPDTAASFADTLTPYGAGEIPIAESDDATKHLITPKVNVLVGLASKCEAPVLVSASATGREITGRVTALTGSGLLSDVVTINDDASTKCSIFGGKCIVDDIGYGASPVYALRPGSIDPEEKSGFVETAETSPPEIGNDIVEIVSFAPAEGGNHPELTEAKLIVSDDREVAFRDGSKNVVEPMADALDATVGASRVTTGAGYYLGQFQIGQIGKTVSPDLYLALGTSSVIQHRTGMQTSKTIVVIDRDEEAPLFEIVDFGVVSGLFDVVPQAIENLK